MIKLFLDQGLPLRTEAILRNEGWEAIHATSAGLAVAPDEEILSWCEERDFVVVTHDHGFHQMIARWNKSIPTVIRIRLQGLDHQAIANLIDRVVRTHTAIIEAGCLVSVTSQRIKIRKLPLR